MGNQVFLNLIKTIPFSMRDWRPTRLTLTCTALVVMLALTGCGNPFVVERNASPNIDTWQEELKDSPNEAAYVVALNHFQISSFVEAIRESCPNITIVGVEELNKRADPTTQKRALTDIVAKLRAKGSPYPHIDIIIAIDTEGTFKKHIGIPPYDFRSGASTYTFYALMLPIAKGEPATRLNVQVTTGGTAFLFPLPIMVETVDDFAPQTAAKKLLSHEIVRHLETRYKSEPLVAGILSLSPYGTREFEGCSGTWEEIKKCRRIENDKHAP